MRDHSAQVYARLRYQHRKLTLDTRQAATLDTVLARSYKDDSDIRRNFVCNSQQQYRPGQRDDGEHCTFIGTTPVYN